MIVRVYDNKLGYHRLVNVAVVIPAEDHGAYKYEIVYDGTGKGDNALWLENPDRFIVPAPWWHIHRFSKIVEDNGYEQRRECRCRMQRTYEL